MVSVLAFPPVCVFLNRIFDHFGDTASGLFAAAFCPSRPGPAASVTSLHSKLISCQTPGALTVLWCLGCSLLPALNVGEGAEGEG